MFNTNYNNDKNIFSKAYSETKNDIDRVFTDKNISVNQKLISLTKLAALACFGIGIAALGVTFTVSLTGAAFLGSLGVAAAALGIILGHEVYVVCKNQQNPVKTEGLATVKGLKNAALGFVYGDGAHAEYNIKMAKIRATCNGTWFKPIWVDFASFFVKK